MTDLYDPDIATLWAYRSGRWFAVLDPGAYPVSSDHEITPKNVSQVLLPDEYQRLPEYTKPIATFTSTSKYQAWDIAEKIDATRGIRRKLLRITMDVTTAGGQRRKVQTYTKVKATRSRSYQIFAAMNRAIGLAKMYLYDKIGTKLLAERHGKKVRIVKVNLEEVI